MATQKKPAKPAKNAKASASGAKKAKPAAPAKKKAAAKPAKKAAPAKKQAPAKKAAAKKAAPAKKVAKAAPAKKAAAKKVVTAKKGVQVKNVTGKKQDQKNNKQVKKTANNKTVQAKPAQAKKSAPAPAKKAATPAKKAPAAKAAAPAKAAAAKKPVAPAKPVAAPAKPEVKKAAAPAKPETKAPKAPEVKAAKRSGPIVKTPTKTVTTFAKTALPSRPSSASASSSNIPSKQATPIRAIDKKPNVIVAHRRLENKAKEAKENKTMINYQPDFTRSILDEPEQQQGPVYRYSDEELNEFRDLIQNRLESARKELAYLQGLITRKDEAGTEDTENRYASMEDGSGAMEREQLAQLASRQIQFINHLEKALIRIENKTYGICRVTGKLIDKARLRAVPHATLSIEAKKTINK